ncbi:MAG TPA: HNH endonuclease domain-containing protein [Chitinophagaceae bacterium]|jgi:CRISPR-associated endonuclease Csn1|nr:HNH endonuclease domain-containing protein [Chitinophagaceae bacterium]
MKRILGLDLGTNSIGWALIEQNFQEKKGKIIGMGSRIIPMSQDVLGDFDKGNSISQTAERTRLRSIRRLRERYLLRRERLHRVLNVLKFLPEHYAKQIDFEKRLGKFIEETEPKISYKPVWNETKKKNEYEFIFKNAFHEMLDDFKNHQPELLKRKNRKGEDPKIPYDWTIYYLRKKGLTYKLEKEEIAWILLNFNQKRGYNQLRGEDGETSSNIKEYVVALKIVQIEKGDADKKNDKKNWYNIKLENGWIYSATFITEPQWLNAEKEFLVTEELDEYGNIKIVKDKKLDKVGKEKRKITPLPSFEEIELMSKKEQDKIYRKIKAKTEITISNSGKTVGTYIYDTLLQKPTQKIRGKLVRTIERKFYKEEIKAILKKQIELQPELFTEDLYNDCVRELYRNNEAHQMILSKRDFIHLFVDDILFYQRPLKSQKSSIGNCTLEFRKYKDANEKEITEYLKTIPKSHPLYQEFRIWQWLFNLKIYKREDNSDVTQDFINKVEDYENLFEFLMTQKEVNHIDILKYLLTPLVKKKFPNAKPKALNLEIANEIAKYRWNYVFDDTEEKEEEKSKKYPCNETGYEIRKRLGKVKDISDNFLTDEIEQQIWHIIYSVTDKDEYKKALHSFAVNHNLNESSFVENFYKFPPFKSEYGSYSEKALKKLLPLLRIGKFWNWNNIDARTKERINKIITGEYDEEIKNRVREKAIHLTEPHHFQGLQLWLAQYIVYDRHSEAALMGKWKSASDLEQYLKEFKQHSLRNPIVEQVITETLRVVRDIWSKYGNGASDYFDEIHIELGREMKNTADERKRLTNIISENESTNLRIKALIMELKDNSDGKLTVDDVRPYSPIQQEALKIYEEGVLKSNIEIPEDIIKISKSAQPSKSELVRYKLWLEQKYRSPYTGKPIPLGKLFTTAYEIEHIIPQSLYFDDSLSNKILCESAVNKLKNNQLGLEFIKNHHGEKVQTDTGELVEIFSENAYRDFINQHYDKNRSKLNKLLLEDIPEKMIERQMNDTRYISKFISNVLSNIVRSDKDDDGLNSKNIVPCNGKITERLRQDWGLNDVWNDLILPRFERLNQLTNSTIFTSTNKEGHIIPSIPFELSKGFQKKRIDHRHHALDALIIACATRDHVNLLNNQYAKSANSRYDLQRKLRSFENVEYTDNTGKRIKRDIPKEFHKPWSSFSVDAKNELENIIVSFKQNLRVINKATNHYLKIENNVKTEKKQEGKNWAIRKPLHKDTVYGKVDLKRIKLAKGKIITATRQGNDLITIFKDVKTKEEALRIIEKITDLGIQKILNNYLSSKNNNPELAFSPEGIEEMNNNISQYNDGKAHQPIYKVRIFELGSKFQLGQKGNKKAKYVEAAKGTNLFFAIYQDQNGLRSYETIPLNVVIERQKQGLTSVPETNEKGDFLLFHLSPNDLVYIPTEDEKEYAKGLDFKNLRKDQIKRIFVVNDFSGNTCYFIPNHISKNIAPKEVDLGFDTKKNKLTGSFDTKTASFEKQQIKEICFKIKVDRLGNITPAF